MQWSGHLLTHQCNPKIQLIVSSAHVLDRLLRIHFTITPVISKIGCQWHIAHLVVYRLCSAVHHHQVAASGAKRPLRYKKFTKFGHDEQTLRCTHNIQLARSMYSSVSAIDELVSRIYVVLTACR